ncbi:MAG TPA: hypothetical protein VLF91_05690 [Candidatus Saccharimonadales bacterium]|nr:hypothetical protein [Candidatus Saccharimonadales bacterium]
MASVTVVQTNSAGQLASWTTLWTLAPMILGLVLMWWGGYGNVYRLRTGNIFATHKGKDRLTTNADGSVTDRTRYYYLLCEWGNPKRNVWVRTDLETYHKLQVQLPYKGFLQLQRTDSGYVMS